MAKARSSVAAAAAQLVKRRSASYFGTLARSHFKRS